MAKEGLVPNECLKPGNTQTQRAEGKSIVNTCLWLDTPRYHSGSQLCHNTTRSMQFPHWKDKAPARFMTGTDFCTMTQKPEVVFPQTLLTRTPFCTCQQNFGLIAVIQTLTLLLTAFQTSTILSLHLAEAVAPSGGYLEVLSELDVHRLLKLHCWTEAEWYNIKSVLVWKESQPWSWALWSLSALHLINLN